MPTEQPMIMRHARTHATFFSVVVVTFTYLLVARQESDFAIALAAAVGSSLWLAGLASIAGVWHTAFKVAIGSLLSLGILAAHDFLLPEYRAICTAMVWGLAVVTALGAITFIGALFLYAGRAGRR